MDILCVISRWIIMCNIYVNYDTCFVVIASLQCYMARAFSSLLKQFCNVAGNISTICV